LEDRFCSEEIARLFLSTLLQREVGDVKVRHKNYDCIIVQIPLLKKRREGRLFES